MTMAAAAAASSTRGLPFTRFENDSAAPLPLIPRRSSSFSGSRRPSESAAPATPTPAPPTMLVVQPPTPLPSPRTQGTFDDRTSSSQAPSWRHKRAHGAGSHSSFFLLPPEHSTPIPPSMQTSTSSEWGSPRRRRHSPIPKELMMTPRVPPATMHRSKSSEPTTPRSISESFASSASTPTISLRLSNGKPLKSSLKSTTPSPRPPLSVIISPDGSARSTKSAPATPSPKAVHFDAKLEHVKLFIAEQKPLAVSRDGSPTDDFDTTSADEFPSFIYGEEKGKLVMQRVNFSDAALQPSSQSAEVVLESVAFAPEVPALNGVVRVKNIAFEKRVAARFTIDDWQTTSEVTARYVNSMAAPLDYDRFSFVIKLHDLVPGRERAMLFAIHYCAGGREYWDNNRGQNYRLRFYHELPAVPSSSSTAKAAAAERQVEDLRSRLEAVVRGQQADDSPKRNKETVGAILAQHSRRRWTSAFSGSSTPADKGDSETEMPPLRFNTTGSRALGERYSFETSFRDQKLARAPPHSRTNTYPNLTSSVPWPRQADSVAHLAPNPVTASHGSRSPSPQSMSRGGEASPIPSSPTQLAHGRRHSRGGGLIDLHMLEGSNVKRTPPASPTALSPIHLPALSSSPSPSPETSSQELPETPDQSGEDESESALATPTPGFVEAPPSLGPDQHGFTPDWVMPLPHKSPVHAKFALQSSEEERSRSPSPNSSLRAAGALEIERKDSPVHHLGDYHVLLNKYCFFTGDESTRSLDSVPRSMSNTTVDDLLSPALSSIDSSLQSSPLPSSSSSRSVTPVVSS